jgi:hypothetical protein
VRWLLLTYRVPTDPAGARVAVWREVRRAGALQVQRSVIAFPDVEPFAQAAERFRTLVAEQGGQTLALRGEPQHPGDGERLAALWQEARNAELRELISEARKYLDEIDHEFAIEKFTLAELDEEEAELEKLQRWRRRIADRDVLGAELAAEADAALQDAAEAFERYSSAVFERSQP